MAGVSSNPLNPAQASVACPYCDSPMPATATFCPGCGRSMKPIPRAERLAAALAYLTLLPAAVLLFLPAFRGNQFVRFHAWQSVLLWGVFFVLTVIAVFLSNITAAVVFLLMGTLASLAMFFLWVVLSLKAWRGEQFELPVFGILALRLA